MYDENGKNDFKIELGKEMKLVHWSCAFKDIIFFKGKTKKHWKIVLNVVNIAILQHIVINGISLSIEKLQDFLTSQ